MKRILIVLGVLGAATSCLALAICAVTFVFLANDERGSNQVSTPPTEAYMGLRKLALETKPAMVGVSADPNSDEPFGILMEFNVSNTPVTVTSFASGDSSIYLASGGGFLGGIGHETIRNAAKRFVTVARNYTSKMQASTDYPLPSSGKVRFYVLTPKGVLTAEATEDDLSQHRSDLSPLFEAGNDVITEHRLVAGQKQK